MRNGKLSKTELNTLKQACDILDEWIDHIAEVTGKDFDELCDDYIWNNASTAACALDEFVYSYEAD